MKTLATSAHYRCPREILRERCTILSVRHGHGSELVVKPVEVEAGEGADDGEENEEENAPTDKTRTPSSQVSSCPPVDKCWVHLAALWTLGIWTLD